jgi:O-acetyl-ADP-ribose deacetylase (regulator of RNase III)
LVGAAILSPALAAGAGAATNRRSGETRALTLAALTLVGTDATLVEAWRGEFARYPSVAILHDSIFNVDADTLVSPANSFGVMDGGLDGKLRDFFGASIEQVVRRYIAEHLHGELPVGLACIAETGHARYRYLISAPTMRCPGDVSRTINAYLAMKALLNVAMGHAAPLHVAVPGLCALTGGMSAPMVARQMRIAYERAVLGRHRYAHWREEREFERYMLGEVHEPPEV